MSERIKGAPSVPVSPETANGGIPSQCNNLSPDGFRCTLDHGHQGAHTAIPEPNATQVSAPLPRQEGEQALIAKLREPIDYSGHDGYGPDGLHHAAADAIEQAWLARDAATSMLSAWQKRAYQAEAELLASHSSPSPVRPEDVNIRGEVITDEALIAHGQDWSSPVQPKLLEIAGLVNAYHNDGTTLTAAQTLKAIADVLGPPMEVVSAPVTPDAIRASIEALAEACHRVGYSDADDQNENATEEAAEMWKLSLCLHRRVDDVVATLSALLAPPETQETP